MSLNLYLGTPKQILWNGPVTQVILPTKTGQMGILRGHIALTTMLETGVLRILFNRLWVPIYVGEGLASIEKDELTVLVNEGFWGNQINQTEAQEQIETAQQNLLKAEKLGEKWWARKQLKIAESRWRAAVEFPAGQSVNNLKNLLLEQPS